MSALQPVEAEAPPTSQVAMVMDAAPESTETVVASEKHPLATTLVQHSEGRVEFTETPPPVATTTSEASVPVADASGIIEAAHRTESDVDEPTEPLASLPPVRADEGSLPPLTSEISADDDAEHEEFFSMPPQAHVLADEPEVEDAHVRAAREATERRAAARRTQSRKYVGAVVGMCALIGALGFGTRLLSSKAPSMKGAAVAAAAAEQTQALAPLPAMELKTEPKAEVQAPKAPPAPPKAEDVPHPDDVQAAPKEEPKVDAKAEKRLAQRALDTGKVADAIEHASASVQADDSDAEAWLLLGAAYQEKGQGAKAKEAFNSCVKLAKRGPKNECAALR